jgi:corrinoid protein of di/trimethylamine methyltransferase
MAIEEIAAAVGDGNVKQVGELVEKAIAGGCEPVEILNKGMLEAMTKVGEKFSKGEIFVPEMMVAARAMKAGLEVLKPKLAGKSTSTKGKCVIGTVAGDLHDIGKNLVAMMIESVGFEIVDLGIDVPIANFVEAAADDGVKLVACSALLTTTMESMKATVEALNASEHRNRFKVIVGGSPVTPEFAKAIGADAYAPDAGGAATVSNQLV